MKHTRFNGDSATLTILCNALDQELSSALVAFRSEQSQDYRESLKRVAIRYQAAMKEFRRLARCIPRS
jgi:hypothetical protein